MATTIETGSSLVLVESLTAVQLFEPTVINPILEKIKQEARSIPVDISTEKGRKAVASLAYKIARTKTFIDSQRVALVADEKKRLAVIDSEGKRIRDELDALKDEVRKPLTDWEESEKQRVASHEHRLSEIVQRGVFTQQNWQTMPIDSMRELLLELENDKSDWQEFSMRAKSAIVEASACIKDSIAKREQYDAEQMELERLRREQQEREQKEREQRIAKEAADRARLAAEAEARREREHAEAEARRREEAERSAKERAIREKQQAEAAAALAEERRKEAVARAEREAQDAIQRERERIERVQREAKEAEARREADRKHRASVNREAMKAFVSGGMSESIAKKAVELIAKGSIPNVKISY